MYVHFALNDRQTDGFLGKRILELLSANGWPLAPLFRDRRLVTAAVRSLHSQLHAPSARRRRLRFRDAPPTGDGSYV